MGFNYSNLHIYDKKGHELALSYTSSVSVSVKNDYGMTEEFFGIADTSGNLEFTKHSGCGRFNSVSNVDAVLTIGSETYDVSISNPQSKEYISSDGSLYDITAIKSSDIGFSFESIAEMVPTATFESKMSFDRVSTGLIETQELFFLVEGTDSSLYAVNSTSEKVSSIEGYTAWKNRYRVVVFTDCREQDNFKTFSVDSDSCEISLSNKQILNFNDDFKVNLAFSGNKEGYYKEPLYIALIDISNNPDDVLSDENDIFIIGSIMLDAETEGEDERYRTLFANMGIPDVAEYNDVFKDSGDNRGSDDYISINKHSKQMFLAYSEIFPYAGSYKALINAVNALGYSDEIFFKEWYKEMGKNTENSTGYISYDVQYKHNPTANTITSKSITERLKLKKLNWLSMMYHLNKEVENQTDIFGFPETVNMFNTYDESFILKLISLRKWLEKYIIGINCHITDVGGEGIYFERYRNDSYGNYQQVLEYNSFKNIAPVIEDRNYILKDSSVSIDINVDSCSSAVTIDDISHLRIQDFCDGYIDAQGKYHPMSDYDGSDASLMVGTTISLLDNMTTYDMRAVTSTDSFYFSNETGGLIKSSGMDMILKDGKLMFNPKNYALGKACDFSGTPIVYLRKANIFDADTYDTNPTYTIEKNSNGYSIYGGETELSSSKDYFTVEYTSLSFKEDNVNGEAFIYAKDASILNGISSVVQGKNLYMDILDGDIKLYDNNNGRTIFINFNWNYETETRDITVKMLYEKSVNSLCKFKNGNDVFLFFNTTDNYSDFVSKYMVSSDDAITIDSVLNLKVFSAGTYRVEVIARNENGDLFGAKAGKDVTILTPDVCMTTYGDNENSGNSYNVTGILSEVTMDASANFEIVPSMPISSIGGNTISYTKRGTYNDSSAVVSFANKKDRFDYAGGWSFVVRNKNGNTSALKSGDSVTLASYDKPFEVPVRFKNYAVSVEYKEEDKLIKLNLGSDSGTLNKNSRIEYYITSNNESKVSIEKIYDDTFSIISEDIIPSYISEGMIVKLIFRINGTEYGMSSYKIKSVEHDAGRIILYGSIFGTKTGLYPVYVSKDGSKYGVYTTKNGIPVQVYTSNEISGDNSTVYITIGSERYQIFTEDETGTVHNSVLISGTPVTTDSSDTDSDSEMEISIKLAHNVAVQYYSENVSNVNSSSSEITLSDTIYNGRLLKFIDTNFTVSSRNFLCTDAQRFWINEDKNLYKFNCPIVVNDYAVCKIDSVPMMVTPKCTIWKLYKNIGTDKKLIGEYYNDKLQIDACENGVYSIEVNTFDVFGNLYSRMFEGAVTVR